jgi:hypothetical protein
MLERVKSLLLLLSALLLRLMVTVAFRLIPYRHLQPLLAATMRQRPRPARYEPNSVERVIKAVERTESLLPAGRCLERALTGWLLLHRRTNCTLRLGVALSGNGEPFAHAWLEADGVVLIGTHDNPFTALTPPDRRL